jgi:hypothetical protein
MFYDGSGMTFFFPVYLGGLFDASVASAESGPSLSAHVAQLAPSEWAAP